MFAQSSNGGGMILISFHRRFQFLYEQVQGEGCIFLLFMTCVLLYIYLLHEYNINLGKRFAQIFFTS